ncbi:MAG: leucyl aminopeptidase [Candidatus Heimdallarchaeota archaeon]|nr:leucyl aminopeptidase [Candidatus Heimdallarchaeota archaeon]
MMFDGRKFYEKDNLEVMESYKKSLLRIKEISNDLASIDTQEKNEFQKLLTNLSSFILKLCSLESKLNDEYFKNNNFDALKKENYELFQEILPENYKTSYANPTFCVNIFGDRLGQLMAYFYQRYYILIDFVFNHKIFKLEEYNQSFIEVYEHLKENSPTYDGLHKILTKILLRDRTRDNIYRLIEAFDPSYQFYSSIVTNDDLSDLRYLFKAGKYITDNEILMAKFLSNYPRDKLKLLAKSILKAFYRGFERDGKTIGNKTNVEIIYSIGMEKLVREVIVQLKKDNLTISINEVNSSRVNKQIDFDHKFDIGLVMNEDLATNMIEYYKNGLETTKEILAAHSGVIYFLGFGEPPFNPENKPEALKLTEEQTKDYQRFYREVNNNHSLYQPRSETSFSIISFPVPDIGEKFEEIFDKIVEINMLDSEKCEQIQQIMIDVMDRADYVHVKGSKGNKTDLKIKLQKIRNPEKETNFVNSGASVNIPAGEVFTSPQLKGTNGILHVAESYQEKLLFKDLTIKFKDGYTEEFSCSNFDTEEENKKYIEQYLLFPHKNLPMGEFAIGTNTLAYVVSRKYDILDVLPILISEKTAPHFAIGDTCFSKREDVKSYNRFTKKLVTACDNEKSILRKTDKQEEAYSYKHNDIVMPFDDIDFITAILHSGESVDIIRNGKFVLKGTEELNIPLLEYEKE